ncbi:MAG: hypothetical protein ACK53Y_13380, partial [bacterium]
MLDTGNSHGAQTVTGGRNGRTTKRGRPLRCRPPSRKKWRSRLCCTMRDGRGGTSEPYRLHPGDTGGPSRRRDVCGPVKPGDSTIGDTCEVQKGGPPRWKIGKEWFCGYPEIRPCNGPGPLPEHH